MTQFQSDEPMGCYDDFDAGRRLRALGQQHGRDAPGALQPHAGDQAPEARRRGSSTSPRAARPRPTTPTCTCCSGPAPTWRSPTASCTCSCADGPHPAVVHRRERRLPARHRRRGEDRLRLLRRAGRTLHVRGRGAASSLDELRTFLADYTPAKVREITGVPVEQIERWPTSTAICRAAP